MKTNMKMTKKMGKVVRHLTSWVLILSGTRDLGRDVKERERVVIILEKGIGGWDKEMELLGNDRCGL